jgi:hypothetical protein
VANEAFVAKRFEPEAVLKPNQLDEVPSVNKRFVKVPFVENRFVLVVFVPVAFVQIRLANEDGAEPVTVKLWMVAVVAFNVPIVELVKVAVVPEIFVAKKFVAVAFVKVASVTKTFEPVAFVHDKFVNTPFVPKRLVVVTDVAVTLARLAFQRRAAVPSENVASPLGVRFDPTKPDTPRFVVVTFEPVALVKVTDPSVVEPCTVNVEVTVELAPMKPP